MNVDVSELWRSAASKQKERDLKHNAVLRTAAQLLVERGVHRTTLADVAERLSITKPALYYYFKSKNEIVLGCFQLGANLAETALDNAEKGCRNGREKLRAYICVYIEVLTVDVGTNVNLLDDRDLDDEHRAQIKELRRSLQNRLKSYIHEGIADGSLRATDVTIAAQTIAGAINGLTHWYKSEGSLPPETIAEQMSNYLMAPLVQD